MIDGWWLMVIMLLLFAIDIVIVIAIDIVIDIDIAIDIVIVIDYSAWLCFRWRSRPDGLLRLRGTALLLWLQSEP